MQSKPTIAAVIVTVDSAGCMGEHNHTAQSGKTLGFLSKSSMVREIGDIRSERMMTDIQYNMPDDLPTDVFCMHTNTGQGETRRESFGLLSFLL